MKHETIERGELLDAELDAALSETVQRAPGEGYDLAAALRIVRRLEISAGRAAVFEEIKAKNPLYRTVDRLYALAGSRVFQPLVLWLYMLKCVLSAGPARSDAGEIAVTLANFPNEEHTIARVCALVPGTAMLHLSLRRRHLLGRGQLAEALRTIGALPRIWRYLAAVARTYSFMPAARIASALAFYMRFSRMFAQRPHLNAAIVASNYSPEAVGMAAAAHRAGRRVIYANHAPVPANGAVVPPVLADCALFYGDMTLQTYRRRSRCTAQVALIGQPLRSRPMAWRKRLDAVGIFLTSGTRTDTLARLVAQIRATQGDIRILIRNHPVALLQNDLSGLFEGDANIEITIGNPLETEIDACDAVICGNSGVALNVLSGGRPVAYVADLDGIHFDANGFVGSGLVCHVAQWDAGTYGRLRTFYDTQGWRDIMRAYDAAYLADPAHLSRRAATVVERHLRSAPLPGPGFAKGQPTDWADAISANR